MHLFRKAEQNFHLVPWAALLYEPYTTGKLIFCWILSTYVRGGSPTAACRIATLVSV
jgi:hypothetical protein